MGGNALYLLGGYTNLTPTGLSHLRFTDGAYPDEWDILGLSAQKPVFFNDYLLAFGPDKPSKSPYGYTRASAVVMMSYDQTMVFLQASESLIKNKESLTGSQMQQALAGLTELNALQGVTGQLAFGSDGDPINKAVAIICNKDGFFKLDMVAGQFLLNEPLRTEYPAKSVCA